MWSDRKLRWFKQLQGCYERGYLAAAEGKASKPTPYEAGSGVQAQRRAAWQRGFDRQRAGKPMDDING